MIETLSIEKALSLPNGIFVDVRTPLEYAEDALPGAVNVPILSNEERIEIGTLYKQKGADAARERGLTVVSPKLPGLYGEIKKIARRGKPIVYCWRGGLRSQTVSAVMDLTGLSVYVLQGGYKSYRRKVLDQLNGSYPFELIILYGLTGAGKTMLLQKMKRQGLPVMDLEGLARHRGSVFGHLGSCEKQTQKKFESLLYAEIQTYKDQPLVFVEGESRRIGPVLLPLAWMARMAEGRKVLIQSAVEKRTQRIVEAYIQTDEPSLPALREALAAIQRRLGGKLFQEIDTLFENKDYARAVRLLLEQYYDRRYLFTARAEKGNFVLTIENNTARDESQAISKLIDYFKISGRT